MSADESLRHIRMARLPGKTTHERQQHILNAIEQLAVAIQQLEAERHMEKTAPPPRKITSSAL